VSRKQRRDKEPPRDFDFFRYEVWFAFAIGVLVATVLSLFIWPIQLLAATLGVSWGLTHLLGRWMLRGRLDRQNQREEEEEKERRALANREAAAIGNEQASRRRHRRRR
jgi:membrane protein implicated in regulation of membrane protease activity